MKRVFNSIILVACIGVIVFIAYSNLRDWNQLEVVYEFHDDGRMFGLYPSDRVSVKYACTHDVIARSVPDEANSGYARINEIASPSLAMTGKCEFQEVVASPVYLDVRYWQPFRYARVEIEYEKDPEVDFQIGYKVGKDFQWKLVEVEEKANRHFDQSESDERSGEIPPGEGRVNDGISRLRYATLEMTLDGEYIPHNNVHRWIFSSNNVQELNKVIRIYGIKFTFTK